jgi:hypothetical protein
MSTAVSLVEASSISQQPLLHVVGADEVAERRERIRIDELFDPQHPPGYYARGAKTALLRRSRRRPHDQLLVEFAGRDVLVELSAASRVLWSHLLTWQATIDGHPLTASGPWAEVCWHTDAEVDYLEIELPLSDGWRLERQFVLGRKDRFVFVGDALLGPADGPSREIRLATTMPLAEGVRYMPADETREAWLVAGRNKVATLVPLALPEWRAELTRSEMAISSEGTLVLTQAARGLHLYSPLWIDLTPGRTRLPLTWRRLAVGESLQTVGRDRATGYRVQFGPQNWLVYRSLAPRGNRTILGQNFSSEFVCCRMLKNGKIEDIIEIQ